MRGVRKDISIVDVGERFNWIIELERLNFQIFRDGWVSEVENYIIRSIKMLKK